MMFDQLNQQLDMARSLVGLAGTIAEVYLAQDAQRRRGKQFASMSPKRRKAVLRGQDPVMYVPSGDGRLMLLRALKAARRARRESLMGKRLAGRQARRARRAARA
jgi:hypothetical protein